MQKIKNATFLNSDDLECLVQDIETTFKEFYYGMVEDITQESKAIEKLNILFEYTLRIATFFDVSFYAMTGVTPDREVLTEADIKKIIKRAKHENE